MLDIRSMRTNGSRHLLRASLAFLPLSFFFFESPRGLSNGPAASACYRAQHVAADAAGLFLEIQAHAFQVEDHITRCDAYLWKPDLNFWVNHVGEWEQVSARVRKIADAIDQAESLWHRLLPSQREIVVRVKTELRVLEDLTEAAVSFLMEDRRNFNDDRYRRYLSEAIERANRIVQAAEESEDCGETGALDLLFGRLESPGI